MFQQLRLMGAIMQETSQLNFLGMLLLYVMELVRLEAMHESIIVTIQEKSVLKSRMMLLTHKSEMVQYQALTK